MKTVDECFDDFVNKDIPAMMGMIQAYCVLYKSKSCEGCRFIEKYKGCYFRQGHTPNEWRIE